MTYGTFGTDLALGLHKTERAIDTAIAEAADLTSLMTRGRIRHRLAASVGQDALAHVGSLTGMLTTYREKIVMAHAALKRDAEVMGIPWEAAGPERKPEEDGPQRGVGGVTLRRVA